ncbi:(2Fe-2S)-binding protein [Streptomyces axinellae]|uniref:Ferric siderophore reductase C-terminal domain-containing protein n=1 Tax=Streptomyces axinellae TaxID=552788 RepID=A0ABN3PTQ8_9ACTN
MDDPPARALDELTALTALTGLASAHGARYHLLAGEPPPSEAAAWLPADRLLAPGTPELERLLDAEHQGSGHRTRHAAALTLIAVYAGRVTAAAVLNWALDGRVWDLRPHNVLVRPGQHGIDGVRMRVPALLADPAAAPGAAAKARRAALPALHEAVLDSHLLPLAEALHRATRAGLRQLHGGVAHGCATALCAPPRLDAEELAARWAEFTAPLPALARLGEPVAVVGATGRRHLRYLRRTCCLYYTSAESVRCASCCLTPRAERIRAYAARLGAT